MTIEIDGPPQGFYEDRHGQEVRFTTYGLASNNAGKLVTALTEFYKWMNQHYGVVVWRQRPKIEWHGGTNPADGRPYPTYILLMRCHFLEPLTHGVSAYVVPIKPEGEEFKII